MALLSDSETKGTLRGRGLVATVTTKDGASKNESLADADFQGYYRGSKDRADGSSGLYCLRGIHSHNNRGGPDDGTPYRYEHVDEGGHIYQAPNGHYRTANSIDETEQNG